MTLHTPTLADLVLLRMVEVHDPDVTFGRIETEVEHEHLCFTLEHLLVDLDRNGLTDPNVSRIPALRYRCRVALSPERGHEVIWIDGVPGRANVQAHKGNKKSHSRGCVLVGDSIGRLDGEFAVLQSKTAFDRLISRQKRYGGVFYLTVKDITP